MENRASRGAICSLEGISGVGKSYLIQALRPALADLPVTFLSEVVDRTGQDLDRDIIALLAKRGDRFFRSGRPLTETFLLLALKMCDYEARIAPALAQNHIVLEDRSLDTIAVYQALILHPDSLERQREAAREIYAIGARFRRPPALTFLIEEDFSVVLPRIALREGKPLTEEEIGVLQRASLLYTHYAQDQNTRFIRLQRQALTLDQMVQTIRTNVLALASQQEKANTNVPLSAD
jgi:dTMP kinase